MFINKKILKKIKKTNNKKKKKESLFRKIGRVILICFLALYILSVIASFSTPNVNEISLSQAIEKIKNKEVEEIVVIDNKIELKIDESTFLYSQKEPISSFTEILIQSGVNPETVNLKVNNQDMAKTIAELFATFAPLILTAVFFWFIFKQASKSQSSIFSFGKSKAKIFRKNKKATFSNVAGLEEAKEEMLEVVDFLKKPEKYLKMGARIPKGVLLVGPSGTGKTLMARAVAGEAKVPFLHMAGSEFMEMLVGIGASRVRDLFKTARKANRAIIFIDELDAIGGVRGLGANPGSGEREQTLNQLLVEMDGLESNKAIIVLAATNRPDILDTALVRPGRFDRTIVLNLPDLTEREAILKLHAQGKPFSKKVSWTAIAKSTVGFSGADLENMLNEAAILTARKNKKTITKKEINESSLKVMLGPQKKRIISEEEKKISAFHEAGHAVASYFSPKTDPVERISIISRGMALGYTLMPPERDRVHEDKTRLLSKIVSLMGGRVAEEAVFDEMTSGAAQDIKHATRIARKMVIELGMSELGPLYYGPQIDDTNQWRSFYSQNEISSETKDQVDKEIKRIVDSCYDQAKKLITKHRKQLDAVAEKLLEKETLEREEFEKAMEK